MIIDDWLFNSFSASSVLSVAEQRTPSHGDIFGIWLTTNGLVRIIFNILNTEYRRQDNRRLCYLWFIIGYFSLASFGYAQDGVCALCGSNNSVNRCKSVSNRRRFEKTKPICGRAKLAQSLIWQVIMKNFMLWRRRENKANSKPNKANLLAFSVLRSAFSVRMRKSNLKKQTQFSKGQNNVKSILIMVYGDFDGPRQRKNKPNSKPISVSPQTCSGGWKNKANFQRPKWT